MLLRLWPETPEVGSGEEIGSLSRHSRFIRTCGFWYVPLRRRCRALVWRNGAEPAARLHGAPSPIQRRRDVLWEVRKAPGWMDSNVSCERISVEVLRQLKWTKKVKISRECKGRDGWYQFHKLQGTEWRHISLKRLQLEKFGFLGCTRNTGQ